MIVLMTCCIFRTFFPPKMRGKCPCVLWSKCWTPFPRCLCSAISTGTGNAEFRTLTSSEQCCCNVSLLSCNQCMELGVSCLYADRSTWILFEHSVLGHLRVYRGDGGQHGPALNLLAALLHTRIAGSSMQGGKVGVASPLRPLAFCCKRCGYVIAELPGGEYFHFPCTLTHCRNPNPHPWCPCAAIYCRNKEIRAS